MATHSSVLAWRIPGTGGAWWAAVYGAVQSWTRLKRPSSRRGSIGFSRQEYCGGLPFPSPVDHVWSEVSSMTCLSWVSLHSMTHCFTELDKAVVHVISLSS